MNNTIRLTTTAAVVVMAALIGYQLLIAPNMGGPPSASPEPTASPEQSSIPEPSAMATEFVIAYPYLSYAEVHAPLREGWKQGLNFVSRSDDAIGFSAWTTDGVFLDPCHWQTSSTGWEPSEDPILFHEGHPAPIVEYLLAQPDRDPSPPTWVNLGGWGAIRIELSVPADLDLETCDLGRYTAWTDVSDPTGGNWNHQPGQTDIVYVVDIDRREVVVHAWLRAGTTTEDLAELEEMLESLQVGFPEDFPE